MAPTSKSSNKSSSAAVEPSIVEKLNLLRSFVGNNNVSETDLSTCLRQSSYNIEMAAERFLTGQYQPPPPSKRRKPSAEVATPTTAKQPAPRRHAATTIMAPVVTPKTPKNHNTQPTTTITTTTGWWLLCQRWISDGICTQRNGCLDYRERLTVEHAGMSGMLRFRGAKMQGQFPKALGSFGVLASKNLIQFEAQALMEERYLPIGAHVAFSLSVWLPDPAAFFQLFQGIESTTDAATSKLFFGKAGKKKPQNALADAAFGLLQWAQHGESYDFAAPILVDDNSSSSSEEEEEEEEEELLEDNVEHPTTEEEPHVPEWTARLETTTAQPTQYQEMDAPKEFKPQLRPYQKQALWWMTQRESQTELEEWSRHQLQLLQELATSSSSSSTSSSSSSSDVEILPPPQKVHCDCGPVYVDASAISAPAVTDNGTSPDLNHPLWERRYLASPDRDQALSFYVQPLFGMAVASPPPPPQPCRGGILADAMGLGKTVMLLALIQSTIKGGGSRRRTTTLIVSPLSLLAQWEEELVSKTNLSYRVHYGDNKKNSHDFDAVDVVLTTYGSLQGELQAHVRQQKQVSSNLPPLSGLLAHSWNRVILDEAHCIKNMATVASRACCLLRAERRWCVSGTIIQNSLEDAYALLKFLKHEPWHEHSFWKAAITNAPDLTVALDRVRRVLTPIMLRRTKESLDKDGKPILTLPPIDSKIIMVEFTPAERQFYDALHEKSLTLFEGFIREGTASKSWLAIFSLLHRLRQTCDHVALTIKAHLDQDEWNSNIAAQTNEDSCEKLKRTGSTPSKGGGIDQKFLDDLMGKFRSMQKNSKSKDDIDAPYATKIANMLNDTARKKSSLLKDECPICLDPINLHDSVVTPCFHIFCKDCLIDVLRGRQPCTQGSSSENKISKAPVSRCPNGPCPVCTEEIESSKILCISESDGKIQTNYLLSSLKPTKSVAVEQEEAAARQVLETAVNGSNSSKLSAILQELDNVWKEDPGSKVLIFSQFLGYLDLMEQSFKSSKIPFSRLDGKLSLKERLAVLQEFGRESPRASTKDSESSSTNRVGSVLLISMKAGGVGLNLVAARTVFIADPWWNAAVEEQCVNRIHRIGQTAEKVRVRKFYVANSVEERIVALQKRKKDVASEVLSDKGSGTGGSGARPSLEDFHILFRGDRKE